MAVDDAENILRLLGHAFPGRLAGDDARKIDGVAVNDDLAHARSDFETLDGHTALLICEAGYLARRCAARHCVIAPIPASGRRLRRGPPGVAAGEQAAAEEGAFQRAIAVHAAAAEASGFAGSVESGNDLAIVAEHARVQIGLEAAQRLAGQD